MAISAIYQHHERTTLAAVEADIQLREIAIDPENKYLVTYSEVLNQKLYTPTHKSTSVDFALATVYSLALISGSIITTGNALFGGTLGVVGAVSLSSSLTFAAGQDVLIADNSAAALTVTQSGNPYLRFVTTDGGEKAILYKALEAQSTLLITGALTNSFLAGTGNRIVTAGTGGALGNSTTIAGSNEFSALQNFGVGLAISGYGTPASATITRTASDGVVIRGVTGSSNDFILEAADGNDILRNPTGTTGITFPGTTAIFANAPTFSSLSSGRMAVISTGGLVAQDSIYWATGGFIGIGASSSSNGHELHISKAGSAITVGAYVENTNNASGSSHARIALVSGGGSGGDAYSLYSIAGAVDWSMGIDNSDSDAFVLSNSSTLGTSNIQRWSSTASALTGTFSATIATAGGTATVLSENTDNTNTASHAIIRAKVAGSSAGDAYARFSVTSVFDWSLGLDNSDSDAFVLSASATIGTANVQRWTTSGSEIAGTLSIAGGIVGPLAVSNRINVAGAADVSGYGVNVLGGVIANSGGVGFVSFGVGVPGDANYEALGLFHDGVDAYISVDRGGTGSTVPLHFYMGGLEAMTIDTARLATFKASLKVEGNYIALPQRSGDPSSPAGGWMYYDTSSGHVKVYCAGDGWVVIA